MKKVLVWVVISLFHGATTLTCRSEADKVSPYFESVRQYKRNFHSSEEECRRLIGQNTTQVCSETSHLNSKGDVSALLNGSDLTTTGKYQLEGGNLVITLPDGPVKTLKRTFKIISHTKLLRVDNGAIRTAY